MKQASAVGALRSLGRRASVSRPRVQASVSAEFMRSLRAEWRACKNRSIAQPPLATEQPRAGLDVHDDGFEVATLGVTAGPKWRRHELIGRRRLAVGTLWQYQRAPQHWPPRLMR
jgi:hypothetical protein